MADPYNQAFYQVPVEGIPGSDTHKPVDMKTGVIASGGNSALTTNDHQARGDSSPIDPTDWRSTARTPAGGPVPPQDITDQTIVEINGRRDTVMAHKIFGNLPADHHAAPTVAEPKPPQLDEQPRSADPDTIAFPEAVDAPANALIAELGESTTMGVLHAVSENRFDLVESMIGTRGSEPGAVMGQVHDAVASYTEHARNLLGASEAEMQGFTRYCDLKATRERSEAIKEFILKQSMKGLKGLYQRFKSEGSTALATDETVFSAAVASGMKASRSANGTTLLHLPQGTMSWQEAERRGLVTIQ